MEAAFARRLDRISRQMDKLGYHVDLGNEAFALYLRRWLAITTAHTGDDSAAVRAEAEKRFTHFIAALAWRMESGRQLHDEIVRSGDAGTE